MAAAAKQGDKDRNDGGRGQSKEDDNLPPLKTLYQICNVAHRLDMQHAHRFPFKLSTNSPFGLFTSRML
jgi:hypothetical protein